MRKLLGGDDVKQILYLVISEVGKEKIQTEMTYDIRSSRKYIDLIMSKCIEKIDPKPNDDDSNQYYLYDTIIAILCEALLHFMLTACTLPSERKITFNTDLVLDVIIPSLQNLKTRPDKSVILKIIKEKAELNKISQLNILQPNGRNIWLISPRPLTTSKYTTYSVFHNTGLSNKYSNIIMDIDSFLKDTGDKSFRFLH